MKKQNEIPDEFKSDKETKYYTDKESRILFSCILVLCVIIVTAFWLFYAFYASPKSAERKEYALQEQIIELAKEDIDIEGDIEKLELIEIEQVGWARYDCYNYILTTTTHRYWIGVMRNENEIHFVDVVSAKEKE